MIVNVYIASFFFKNVIINVNIVYEIKYIFVATTASFFYTNFNAFSTAPLLKTVAKVIDCFF